MIMLKKLFILMLSISLNSYGKDIYVSPAQELDFAVKTQEDILLELWSAPLAASCQPRKSINIRATEKKEKGASENTEANPFVVVRILDDQNVSCDFRLADESSLKLRFLPQSNRDEIMETFFRFRRAEDERQSFEMGKAVGAIGYLKAMVGGNPPWLTVENEKGIVKTPQGTFKIVFAGSDSRFRVWRVEAQDSTISSGYHIKSNVSSSGLIASMNLISQSKTKKDEIVIVTRADMKASTLLRMFP